MPDQKLTYEELLIENENLKKTLSEKKDIEFPLHKEFIHFFELAPALVVIASTHGYFKQLNKIWEDVLGYTLEELKSKPFIEFIHPDDVEATLKKADRKTKKQPTSYFKNRYRCKNGEYKCLEWMSITTPDDKNLYAIARDITEKVKAEQALIESKNRYKNIFQDSKSVMLIIEPETGKIIDANNSASTYYSYTKKELLALNVADINILSKAQIEQEMQKAILEKKNYFEFKHRLAKGEVRDVQVYSSKIEINKKNFLYSVINDVTAQRKAEKALKQSETQLKELNITKDKFFSIIAHDLRSPFNTILGFSQLLADNDGDFEKTETKEIAETIYSSAKKTLSLLDNLLNWAKTQTGQIKISPKRIVLSTLIQETMHSFHPIAAHKNISLHFTQSGNFEMHSDSNMLETILRNLLSNAIKFTKEGGNISLCILSNQEQVEISIIDDGVGMSAEKCKHLFKFSTNKTSVGTANEVGSGLGLLLCKEFVQKLGGEIWVESEKNKGSKFTFSIPTIN
jgi:PAS domain S-box-containing protein